MSSLRRIAAKVANISDNWRYISDEDLVQTFVDAIECEGLIIMPKEITEEMNDVLVDCDVSHFDEAWPKLIEVRPNLKQTGVTSMDTVTFKYSLGNIVRDCVTGFEGMIDSRTQWLNGCIRYSVQPQKLTKDGDPVKNIWVDEEQLVLINPTASERNVRQTGGPQNDPDTFSR